MSENKAYTGSCHCGKVTYTVDLDINHVISCNCSICAKQGTLLSFAPESALTILSGEDNLTDYQFNKKIIHHLFCATCGVKPFGKGTAPDGSKMVALNVRCLDGVEVDSLTITPYDGKNL